VTVVFVHGNPETEAIWEPLIAALGRDDAITLSPPGFGAPAPDRFGATATEYAAWLAGELSQLRGPIDLIGHDWGGAHVVLATALRPDLVRTLVTDVAGIFDPEYVWHDMAQVWRTPGEGEAALAAMEAISVDDRAGAFTGLGMTPEAARSCAAAGGSEMSRCILALYRSAGPEVLVGVGRQFVAVADRVTPHVIVATDDVYTGGEVLARRVAEQWAAPVTVLDGLGHWWMLQDPVRSAHALASILPAP
jgi:pimeloyl-ACP methyl ester carboxylesterase